MAPCNDGKATGLDHDALALRLMRHWRGEKTQITMSTELGFASNTVTHWESGRRSCRASTAMRMAEIASPGTLATVAEHSRAEWESQIRLDTPEGVALLLGATMHHRAAADVAAHLGISRHVVGRWLRADAEPSLPSFLRFLDATMALPWVLSTMAPGLSAAVMLPGADPTRPVAAHVALVSLALELSDYTDLPRHDSAWLAGRCHMDAERVDRALTNLHHMGAIEWTGSHWAVRSAGLPMKGHLVRRPDPDGFRHLKEELSEITKDLQPPWENTTLSVVTPEQLRRVCRILSHAHSQILDVVRHNRSEGRLLVLRMEAITLPGGSPDLGPSTRGDAE
ncbi:MAG: helix-turn-helix domain-containing protein [Myxococcales bacterium]|nr:helix-turn-helix domain-containing protein [Myxococcales bacterium]